MANKNNISIHQLLPGFTSGDAISNYTMSLKDIIEEWGYNSEIFCTGRHVSPAMRGYSKDWEEYRQYSNKDNILIYHFSIGSPLSEQFRHVPDRKVIIYHNITPEKYFRSINAEKALALYHGREELKTLHDAPEIAIADSEYNRLELEEWGYKKTIVIPPLLDFGGLKKKPSKNIVNRYKDDWVNILFVGRVTPNKKIEDVIKVFYYYKNTINKKSRLFIVGSFVGMERYCDYLRGLTMELNLQDVIFAGHVTTEELVAYYTLSDIFLCMSEHEGFCVPLVESMYFKVPIIAYSAAAVPYTLGNSGILVDKKDYVNIAELVNFIITNTDSKNKIINGQNRRLNDFSRETIGKTFEKYLKNI